MLLSAQESERERTTKIATISFYISMYGADFRSPGLPKGRFGLSADSHNIIYIKTLIFIVNKVISKRRDAPFSSFSAIFNLHPDSTSNCNRALS